MPTWLTKLFTAGAVLQAADLNQIRDNFILLDQHTHSGADGDGAAVIESASSQGVGDRVPIWMRFPKSAVGFTYSTVGALSGAQNDEIVFPVGLRAGTWKLILAYQAESNKGIVTVYLDAVSKGTRDMYEASAFVRVNEVTSIAVAAAGWYDLKLKMETKNASSSGYAATFHSACLLRTGA
jgi:hypothetical protein